MDHVQQAFGEDADLYQVLGLKDRDDAEHPAKLRKAYFRAALLYHPDKTQAANAEVAKEKFQAISFAYQVLKNAEQRAEYNDTGHVDENHDDDDNKNKTQKDWKEYFDRIFGKVTKSKIDQFSLKYKCSEEEQRDVLKEYKRWKGDLVKMLEYVMLSTPLDAKRWVEDYIGPAVSDGSVPAHSAVVNKSLKKLEKKLEKEQGKTNAAKKGKATAGKAKSSKKENVKPESSDEDDDDEEEEEFEEMSEEEEDDSATETEEDEEEVVAKPVAAKPTKKGASAAAATKKKVTATKAKPSKAKASKKNAKGKEADLFAMVQANQASRSENLFASLGARYGVDMEEDDDKDPLDDEAFERIQKKLGNKKKRAR